MSNSQPELRRGIGLFQATSTNMLEMIGIGPFITIPILLATMNGPQALLGWVIAGILAVCDGLVWAELGAAMPGAGGPYHYLKEAFGPESLGRMMSFLFLWETTVIAPISLASGAVGLSMYVKFYWPAMGPWQAKLVAMLVCLLCMVLLYRDIREVGRLSVVMWVVVMATVAWVVIAGLLNFQFSRVFDFPPHAFDLSPKWLAGLGGASLIAIYSYGGYFNVCLFGGEVKNPSRTIPWSILYAILGVGVIYVLMSVTIVGVVPWREAIHSTSIVSDFIERIFGHWAANLMTALILWTSIASVFAIMLGYSRVPYAAAVDGRFFRAFARMHPTKAFPTFSLLFIGFTAMIACVYPLDALISALMVIQIVTQFMPQVIAVTMIRRNRPDIQRPFRMWLYPVPNVLAFCGWAWILLSSGWQFIALGFAILLVGIGAYMVLARQRREWPFAGA
ncbi:APC family permease [Paludibaculum fermentans]|uniref:APC family permease n=1 Tax=Paludibaculum fermentans TaxID=1473598 RepID=UPI003EBEEC84